MVIQRWQSVLLLVAGVLMACFSFMTVAQVNTADFTFNLSPLGFSYAGEATDVARQGYECHTWFFFILSIMSALLPLIAIFLFRNLSLQMRVCLVSVLFEVACCACCLAAAYSTFEGGEVSWNEVSCAPFLAICATVMAWQRISADKRLLESADRLR